MPRTPGRSPAVLLAVISALAVTLGLLVAPPASAAGTGSLSGVVQGKPAGGSATPLAGATVLLYRSDTPDGSSASAGSTTTAANGTWSVTGLDDGYYTVRVIGPDDSLGEEYWDNGWSPYDVTVVHVTGGAVALPRPIVLETPGWVTGRVLDEAGDPVVGASVTFRASEDAGGYGLSTDAEGRYDSRDGQYTDPLIPGTYFVGVSSYGSDLDDPVYRENEVEVTVTAGAGTTHDVTLVERPSVVLTVLDREGVPLVEAPIGLQVRFPDFMNGWWGPPQSGPHLTDASGRYRITDQYDAVKVSAGLPEGDTGTEAREWWNGAYSFDEATSITFPDGVALRRELTIQLGDAPTAVQPATPTISGEARVGRTLTVDPGAWGPSGVALTYQWLDSGFAIPDATGPTYTLPASMEGSHFSVRVTGKVAGQPAVDRTSAYTSAVLPSDGSTDPEPEVTGATPQISGTPRAGRTLTAVPGSWGPAGVVLGYTWSAGGATVGTGPTLKVTNALAGKTVTLTVRGERGGSSAVRSSAPTTAVVGVLSAGRPKVTGKTKVGKTLQARPGTWSPGPVTLRLTWFRNGTKAGTGTSYRLSGKDLGKRISVRVTGTRRHFATLVVSSAKTAKVTSLRG